MDTGTNPDPECVAGVRRFSRFYTQRLGLLEREILDSDFSLTESRVLWELTHRAPLTASQLCRDLGLNAGYLSRLLRRLRAAGLVRDQVCREDARAHRLSLPGQPRSTAKIRTERLESDGRRVSPGRRRVFLVPGAHR